MHLSYSSNSGAAKICQRGQSEGAKRPSEGRVWEGEPPTSHGREIFSKFVYEILDVYVY